jgi:hypothetical protein
MQVCVRTAQAGRYARCECPVFMPLVSPSSYGPYRPIFVWPSLPHFCVALVAPSFSLHHGVKNRSTISTRAAVPWWPSHIKAAQCQVRCALPPPKVCVTVECSPEHTLVGPEHHHACMQFRADVVNAGELPIGHLQEEA